MLKHRRRRNSCIRSATGKWIQSALGGLIVLYFGAVPAVANPLGRVATLGGVVTAMGPSGSRSLVCGDRVFEGDTLETASSSHVGILMGDVLAHLDADSTLLLDEDGELRLESGRVRLIDAVGGDEVHRLSALGARASSRGNDSEAYIVKEKTGRYAMLCEWNAPLPVEREGESRVVQPGECVVAKKDEALYPTRAHDERIGPDDAGTCAAEIPVGRIADHVPLLDVGSGPSSLALDFEPPIGPRAPAPDPCDQPGSGCFGTASTGAPVPTRVPPVATPPPPMPR